MNLTLDDIKQEVAAGKITAISLDTSIFDGQQRGLERGLLKRVSQFNGTAVTVVLSDIVVRELEAHLRRDAAEAQSNLKKALKNAGQAWQLSESKRGVLETEIFGTDTVEQVARRRLDGFISGTNAKITKAEEQQLMPELMRRYFEHQPPFAENAKKKNEFPDALALLTLESWAKERDTKVLVVTNDNDWRRYCAAPTRLVAIDNLVEALGCFQQEEVAYLCDQLSKSISDGDPHHVSDAIEQAIQEQDWKIQFIPEANSQFHFKEDFPEAELQLIRINGIESGDALEPVEYEDGELVARVSVDVSADVTCNFSFEKWDAIDKEYIPMGSGTAVAATEISIELLVTFSGHLPEAPEIVEIEVLEQREQMDFGEIGPDWMNDPANFGD